MGIAVVLTLVLYVLIWLRIRGNIRVGDRWYPTFTIRHRERAPQTSSMANQVLWHPLVYSALMAPLFAVRVAQLVGDRVPWQVLDATTLVFLLSGKRPPSGFRNIALTHCTGLANVILYTSARRFFILPHLNSVAARKLPIKHQDEAVTSTQTFPHYQREALESQATFVSTAQTLVFPANARHSSHQSPNIQSPNIISAPSSLPSIAVDLTSPRQAPKPPSKSSLRASIAPASGSGPARPLDYTPTLIVERRLTKQISFPFSLESADSNPGSPRTPWDPQTSFDQSSQRPLPSRPLPSLPIASQFLGSDFRKSQTSETLDLETGRT